MVGFNFMGGGGEGMGLSHLGWRRHCVHRRRGIIDRTGTRVGGLNAFMVILVFKIYMQNGSGSLIHFDEAT